MTEFEIETALQELLLGTPIEDTELADEDGEGPGIREVCTYAEGGYLTFDRGLVFRTADGSEFQLTIKQTR